MAKKENKGLGLPPTKGFFQISGLTTGTEKQGFYKETMTKTSNKPFRMVNFGVRVDKDTTHYVSLNGGEKENVYFSKSETKDGKKTTDVQEVAWKNRFDFNKEGYKLIGVNIGVTKTFDAKGKEVNDKKVVTDYDACKIINENLKDDQSVFIKGNVDFSHYDDDKGNMKRSVKFIPNQISLCKPIDFDGEKFSPTADFTQVIVFMGVRKEEKRSVVEAKIVNYNSIEDTEFFIDDANLAQQFKKNLKPYTAIKVWGNISATIETESVTETDVWGSKNSMEKVNSAAQRELIIVGADPSTIETDTYSEANIAAAIAKMNSNKKAKEDFGDAPWGSGSKPAVEDDEDNSGW